MTEREPARLLHGVFHLADHQAVRARVGKIPKISEIIYE